MARQEYFSTRLPAPMLAALKAAADARGVKVSAIAREAFDLYIARVIENRCPVCGTVNPEAAARCMQCGAALTPAALRADADSVARTGRAFGDAVAKIEAQLAAAAAHLGESEEILSRVRAIEERARAKAPGEDLPPSERPRPADEQTITEE